MLWLISSAVGLRVLGAKPEFSTTLTPSSCISSCWSSNYSYAGVSYRYYLPACTCTNSLELASLISDEYCRVSCPQENHLACGGYGVNRIFSIVPPTTVEPIRTTPTTVFQDSSTAEMTTLVPEITTMVTTQIIVTEQDVTFTEDTSSEGRDLSTLFVDGTEFPKRQTDLELWYICGAISLVFIVSLVIVAFNIRNNRRKWSHPKSFDPETAGPRASDNIYDEGDMPKSPIYQEVDTDDERAAYTEVPETAGPEPNAFYHTVHRPQSTTADDEVKYGNTGVMLAGGAIYEDANEIRPATECSKNKRKESHSSSVGSVENALYSKSTKVSQSSVGSVENVIYDNRKCDYSKKVSKDRQSTSYKQSCSSIGS
ncbi:uncharacterized protein [Amphiura filiformis]|uniref:uncharacterized protein isoform X2 n=1 Tax=Amphiura filiformis TaxID=82378 RepID=UPI003B222A5C